MVEKRMSVLSTATAAVAAAICLAPGAASAATITPDVLSDEHTNNESCSLREAISIANTDSTATEPDCAVTGGLGDDEVSLGTGTYVLELLGLDNTNAAGDLDVNPSGFAGDLTIDGASATATTIDTHDGSGWTERVLDQVGGATSPLVVSDLTITGGNAINDEDGGGIQSSAGSLTLQSARVTDNDGESGAGINAEGSSLSIIDSTIDGNANPVNSGGGVLINGGFGSMPVTIDSSVIFENFATNGSGGGINATATTMTITDSLIADNVAAENTGSVQGGGILAADSFGGGTSTVTVRGTTISGNEVVGGTSRAGGGVAVESGSFTLVNSTVSDNEALLSGGSAGGILIEDGNVDLIQTTVGPNPSGVGPAAISETAGGSVGMRGSVIESLGGFDACGGFVKTGAFNVFRDDSCGTPGEGDEVDADPLLGPLTDNGGPDAGAPGFEQPILTHAPAAASTAVDHVPAAECFDDLGDPLLVDQLGALRPQDSDDPGTVADCEAGSVEIAATPTTVPRQPPTHAARPAGPGREEVQEGPEAEEGEVREEEAEEEVAAASQVTCSPVR